MAEGRGARHGGGLRARPAPTARISRTSRSEFRLSDEQGFGFAAREGIADSCRAQQDAGTAEVVEDLLPAARAVPRGGSRAHRRRRQGALRARGPRHPQALARGGSSEAEGNDQRVPGLDRSDRRVAPVRRSPAAPRPMARPTRPDLPAPPPSAPRPWSALPSVLTNTRRTTSPSARILRAITG